MQDSVLEIDKLIFGQIGIPAHRPGAERADIREIRERGYQLVALKIQLLVPVRAEEDDMLLLLGREALIQLVEVAFVEDIIALNAVLLADIVFELVIGVVKNAVAVEIYPHAPALCPVEIARYPVRYNGGLYPQVAEEIAYQQAQHQRHGAEGREMPNGKSSVRLATDKPAGAEALEPPVLSYRAVGAVIERGAVADAVHPDLDTKVVDLCTVKFKLHTPECTRAYARLVMLVLGVGQLERSALAVDDEIHLGLAAIHEYRGFEEAVKDESAAPDFEPVGDNTDLLCLIDRLTLLKQRGGPTVIDKAQGVLIALQGDFAAPLEIDKEMLVIKIHAGALEYHVVVDFFDKRENTLDRLIEFRLGVIIGQEPVLNGLPIQVVEVYSLIIAGYFIAVGGKEPLPHGHGILKDIVGEAAPVGRAARVAQVIILRLLAVAYLHLIPDDAAAIVDILVEFQLLVKERGLALAEIFDADIHRRLADVAVLTLVEVIYPAVAEHLESRVHGVALLLPIRDYLVGDKVDLVIVLVKEARDGLESIL